MSGQRAQLRAVWAKIPDSQCKGLCVESCGPVAASRLELRLLERRGVHLPDVGETITRVLAGGDDLDCPALVAGRCSVYDVRPTVCRLWGSVEDMPCPWGCEPEGGRLATDEGFAILGESLSVGGRPER